MKWFKHFSAAKYDPKIMRLIRKHGLRGYGLYFGIIESIAFQLDTGKPYPELEGNAQDIASFFGEDTILIEEIIKFCIENGLFEYNTETGRLSCLKLLTHLDNTMSSNPQIAGILKNFNKLQETLSEKKSLEVSKSRLDEIRLDEIRLDENRLDNTLPASAGSDFMNIFNEAISKYPKIKPIKLLSKKRLYKLYARVKDKNYLEHFKLAMLKISESDFLQGNNSNWKITFDWLIENDTNILKVCEGQYDGKKNIQVKKSNAEILGLKE